MLPSACIMVGEYVETLPRTLHSLAGVADEILILSTADSEDLSRISRNFSARVCRIPWADDFAAVRNVGFSLARSPWILWLDSDEWLDEASRHELNVCIESSTALVWLVNIHDRSGAQGVSRYSPTALPRLFRRLPELQLTGRVHEHFNPELNLTARKLKLSIERSNITIFHDGYHPDKEADKLRRNIRLMELELQDRPGELFYQIRLSQALLKIGDSRAFHFLRQAWQQVRPVSASDQPPPEALVAELLDSILVRQIRGEFDSGESVEELLERAANWYPLWPPLIWRRANWKFKSGRMEEAVAALEHILQLAAAGSYQHTPSFDAAILAGETCLSLGICYAGLQRLDIAEHYFILAARDPARKLAAEHNLTLLAAARRGRAGGHGREASGRDHS